MDDVADDVACSQGALPEDVCRSAEEVLLLLVAAGAHPSVDDGEQRLDQTQDQWAARLPCHEHLHQVQHLQQEAGQPQLSLYVQC